MNDKNITGRAEMFFIRTPPVRTVKKKKKKANESVTPHGFKIP